MGWWFIVTAIKRRKSTCVIEISSLIVTNLENTTWESPCIDGLSASCSAYVLVQWHQHFLWSSTSNFYCFLEMFISENFNWKALTNCPKHGWHRLCIFDTNLWHWTRGRPEGHMIQAYYEYVRTFLVGVGALSNHRRMENWKPTQDMTSLCKGPQYIFCHRDRQRCLHARSL